MQHLPVCELTAVEVGCVGFEVHDAGDSLSDHKVSSSIPLPHLKYSSGPCIRHIQVICNKTEIDVSLHFKNRLQVLQTTTRSENIAYESCDVLNMHNNVYNINYF